jgi:hypothetical protein
MIQPLSATLKNTAQSVMDAAKPAAITPLSAPAPTPTQASTQATVGTAASSAAQGAQQRASAIQSGAWAPPTPAAPIPTPPPEGGMGGGVRGMGGGEYPHQANSGNTQAIANRAAQGAATAATQKAEAAKSLTATPATTAAPEPIAPISIDPNDPNAVEQVRQTQEQMHISRVLQQFDAKAQADVDRYSQVLAERNITGGANNALIGMLYRDQSVRRNDLHYQLERDHLEKLDAEESVEQQTFMNLFNQAAMGGDVESALALAAEMAEIYPDNEFWTSMASNPAMQEVFRNSMSPAVQQRKVLNQAFARESAAVAVGNRWNDVDAVESAWPEFLANEMKSFSSPNEAQILARSWASGSPEEAAAYVEAVTGIDFGQAIGDVPADILAKAYVRKTYESYAKLQADTMFEEDALSYASSFGSTPAELDKVRDLAGLIASGDDRTISIDGMMVSNTAFSNLGGGPLSYLYTDWNGREYGDANPRPTTGRNYSLDQAWKQAFNLGLTEGVGRDQFADLIEDAAIDQGIDLDSGVSDAQMRNVVRQASTQLNAVTAQGLPADQKMRNDMVSGAMPLSSDSLVRATLGMDVASKADFYAELVASGKVPPLGTNMAAPATHPALASFLQNQQQGTVLAYDPNIGVVNVVLRVSPDGAGINEPITLLSEVYPLGSSTPVTSQSFVLDRGYYHNTFIPQARAGGAQ